jgi:hypothetical protein
LKGAFQSTATKQEAVQQFFKQRSRCAITGCPLSIIKLLFSTMSLDAIIPGQPHAADNIQWVCLRVNMGKRQCSDTEFRMWAKAAFTWSGRPESLLDIACNSNGDDCDTYYDDDESDIDGDSDDADE